MMRIVNICGYDGAICERYQVAIDEKGNIKETELECNGCVHNGFMGSPWARTELITERSED